MDGPKARGNYSVTVSGTKVTRHQSAPGAVQENGDIKFASGMIYSKQHCNDISGSYIRSVDKAIIAVEQVGCDARFFRMSGTKGPEKRSATVSGTQVTVYQSAPGVVQENGDIRFASGVIYSKQHCNDISGSYIRSVDNAINAVEQVGCDASFIRMSGTNGPEKRSATVSGTKVTVYQSAPGVVQENGDIRFASGV